MSISGNNAGNSGMVRWMLLLAVATVLSLVSGAYAQTDPNCPYPNSTVNKAKSKPPHYVCDCNSGFHPVAGACVTLRLSGPWKPDEAKRLASALGAVKNDEIRSWLANRLEFVRYKADSFSPITAFGGIVRVKDGFFAMENRYERENLVAFESGKAFWDQMKNRNLEGWFRGYQTRNVAMMADLRITLHGRTSGKDGKSKPVSMSAYGDTIDYHSSFGHYFRAEALQLSAPKWKREMDEFRAKIIPLVR